MQSSVRNIRTGCACVGAGVFRAGLTKRVGGEQSFLFLFNECVSHRQLWCFIQPLIPSSSDREVINSQMGVSEASGKERTEVCKPSRGGRIISSLSF